MIAPSLPSLHYLPLYVAIDGAAGYLCGKLTQSNPELTAVVFAIRSLALTLFYHLANYFIGKSELDSQKIFLVTSTIVNMIFLVVLRELNIIGRLSSFILGVAILGHLIHRVSYIQDQERQLILDEVNS